METIETPHATIAYSDQGDGIPIVMLPSGAHDHHDFDELRALLPAGVRSIAIDWPGHGNSSAPRTPTTVVQFAEVTASVVRQLCPAGAIVMGNSIGGFSATRLAITLPDLVNGLVIVDGGGFTGRSPALRAFCAAMGNPRFLRAIYPTFARLYMRAQSDADARSLAAGIATTRSDPGLHTVADLWSSFSSSDHDLRTTAAQIATPTLIIWGKRDPVIPLRYGRKIQRAITGSQLHVLDTGHVPHTSDPQAVADLLVPFIDEVSASAD